MDLRSRRNCRRCGLAVGIVSYFIPKPEPPKAPVVAVPVPVPSVNVEGNGNIGVGSMTGGTITQGAAAGGEAAKTKK